MDRPQYGQDDEDGGAPLEGRRALVVGGSGGIGAELSVALARRGARLVIHGGSSREALDRTLARVREAQTKAGFKADAEGLLLHIEAPTDLVGRLPGLGRLDLACLAFGPFLQAPLHENSTADWERMSLLNLALPGSVASALLPSMRERGYGRFLFFGGTRTDTIRSCSTNAAYAAAKTGLGVLVKSIAAEYADRDIAAFLLCPGFVETEYLAPGLAEALAAKSPKGRLLDAAAVADFGARLLCERDSIASGAIVALDGGLKW